MTEWNVAEVTDHPGWVVHTLIEPQGIRVASFLSAVVFADGGWYVSPAGESFDTTVERIQNKATIRYPTEEAAKVALLILKK